MKTLTYNDYIAAKAMIKTLCEDTDIVEELKSKHPKIYAIEPQLNEMGYIFSAGMTKGVLYNPQYLPDWVIKFDLHDPIWYKGKETTYCEVEYRHYREAAALGYENYFATCKRICNYDSITFYLMEYVECDESAVSELLVSEMLESGEVEDLDEAYSAVNCLDTFDAISLAFNDVKFAAWADNNQISDLHSGNFGYTIDDNRLVIIDYSGYGFCCV